MIITLKSDTSELQAYILLPHNLFVDQDTALSVANAVRAAISVAEIPRGANFNHVHIAEGSKHYELRLES